MAARPDATPAHAAPDALTVSQLAERISDALGSAFPSPVRVVGEVTGFKPGTHWYFSLKDAGAVVPCVMFSNLVRSASFRPADGQQVVATGRPDHWAKGGRTSFIVTRLEPVGQGALDAAFQAMCDELRRLGWFDPARKRPVPAFPRRVAVVTSLEGAAVQDVLATMKRRCPAVEVALVDVAVQGGSAAGEVAAAIRWIGRHRERLGVDVVLVTRGGGSREDLWAFNERVVAEAIVTCPLPVVAAIGHESDVTIAELVADERCATPTQAAMRLTPEMPALLEQLAAAGSMLRAAASRAASDRRRRLEACVRHAATAGAALVSRAARRVEEAGSRLERHRPAAVYARREALLDAGIARLNRAIHARLDATDPVPAQLLLAGAIAARIARASERLDACTRHLTAVGPQAVLERGYSVTTRADGSIVRSAADVKPGDPVHTRVADGSFRSTVDGSGSSAKRSTRPRRDAADGGLFSGTG